MSRFKEYLNCHFKGYGCRLMGRGHDPHRDRPVEVYAVPGHVDVVGITDGTDSWIAPAVVGTYCGADLTEQVRRLKDGLPLLPVPDAPPRRARVRLDGPVPQPAATAAASPRRQRVRI